LSPFEADGGLFKNQSMSTLLFLYCILPFYEPIVVVPLTFLSTQKN
jgi:hypothetical protein